jgi:lysophospholipase L1-like esterase
LVKRFLQGRWRLLGVVVVFVAGGTLVEFRLHHRRMWAEQTRVLQSWSRGPLVTVEGEASDPAVIGIIGDSLSLIGYEPYDYDAGAAPVAATRTFLAGTHLHGLMMVNAAAWGSTTRDWEPTSHSGLFERSERAFLARRVRFVSVCLGTNDANAGVPPAQYRATLKGIVGQLRHDGLVVVVNGPPYEAVRSPSDGPVLLKEYNDLIPELCREVGARAGDTQSYAAFARSPLFVDGIHPNAEGARLLGDLWATAWIRVDTNR